MNNEQFMQIALKEAQKALLCGEFPVGCVLVHREQVIATGSRIGTAQGGKNETDHAEMLALRQLSATDIDCDPTEITAYCTLEPCLMCYGASMIARIGQIVFAYEDVMGGGTGCDLQSLPALYKESDIEVIPGVLRAESLALFKTFFSNPGNKYWKGSLLERYTLSQ
jgi:tRNA(adenine34) deaminase